MSVILAVLLALNAAPGRRADLGVEGARLYVPDGYIPVPDGAVNVLLHLHGAPSVVEPAFVAAGWSGVLVTFNRKGLSSVYETPFADPTLFPKLLDATLAALHDMKRADGLKVGRVVVSSFSAGFGGVRAVLKVPEHRARINGLVMLDSLYAGYAGDPAFKNVDPAKVADFRRFAVEAAAGRNWFLLTHSAQVPPGYASTTETADDLIRALGGASRPTSFDWKNGWIQTRTFEKGRFVVLGFDGVGPDDHLAHLRRVAEVWKRARMLDKADP